MEEQAPYTTPPMPAAWCNARRAEIQAAVDGDGRRNAQETRTMLIELLAQVKQADARADERLEEACEANERAAAFGDAISRATCQLEDWDGVRSELELLGCAQDGFPTVLDAQLHDLWKHTAPRFELETAEAELQQARQQLAARAWVSVAERLPAPNTDVLVWPKTRKEGVAPHTKVYVAEYYRAYSADQQPAYWQGEQEWWDVWEITHWQPLPTAPRG